MKKLPKNNPSFNYMALPGLKSDRMKRDDIEYLRKLSFEHSFHVLVDIVCEVTGVSKSKILTGKTGQFVRARQLIMYYLYIHTNCPLKTIGMFLKPGKPMHHATVIYGREVIKERLKERNRKPKDLEVKEFCSQIEEKLKLCVSLHSQD